MSLLPSATYSAPGAPLYGSGGGGGGSGSFTSTVTIGPNATSTSQFVLYGNADEKLKMTSTDNKSAIFHTGAAGSADAGQIIWSAGTGNMTFTDNGGNVMMAISSSTRGVDMSTVLQMNANLLSLGGNNQSGLYWNATDSNTYITGLSTHAVAIGTQAAPVQLQISDTSINMPTAVFMDQGSISSLTVSSINGATPGGSGRTTVALSNFSGNSATIPLGNLAYPLSALAPVTSNHTYRISANIAMSNGDAAGFTAVGVNGGGLAGFPLFMTTLKNVDLVPSLNGGSSGIETIFRASANGSVQVEAYNTSAASNTLLEVQANGVGGGCAWLLEDLGVGLL